MQSSSPSRMPGSLAMLMALAAAPATNEAIEALARADVRIPKAYRPPVNHGWTGDGIAPSQPSRQQRRAAKRAQMQRQASTVSTVEVDQAEAKEDNRAAT